MGDEFTAYAKAYWAAREAGKSENAAKEDGLAAITALGIEKDGAA